MIDILFTGSNSLSAWIVKAFTWSRYSHVGMVYTENGIEWYISAKPNGGVVKQTLASFLAESPIVAQKRVTVLGLPLAACGRVLKLSESLAAAHTPYDWWGCIGLGLHHDWQHPGRFWCSEFVAYCFQQAGFPLLGNEADIQRVTPQDLLFSNFLS